MLQAQLHDFLTMSKSLVRHPLDGVERVRGRIDRRHDEGDWQALGSSPTEFYGVVQDWLPRLHRAIGSPWPCDLADAFVPVWSDLVAMSSAAGLRLGRASYGGWNDGDRRFAHAVWCAVAHLRPSIVVETGVAHGVTSRVILEALERNGAGHLWSIDLPAVDPALDSEVGIVVPRRLHHRWTYVKGTSRRRLPPLVAELPTIGVFVHDSLHTGRNMCFELETIWPALSEPGVAIVDDISHNVGFRAFTAAAAPSEVMAVTHEDEADVWGVAVKGASA